MTLKEITLDWSKPLSQWPVFYVDGEPYIYDDSELFLDENEEPMGQHPRHSKLAIYLYELLVWLYRAQVYTITFDLFMKVNIDLLAASAADASQEKTAAVRLTPDVALVKGINQPDKATYVVELDGPPPNVVFEVASESTFREDLNNKLRLYASAFEAKEYIAYDPHQPRLWSGSRLKAWRLEGTDYVPLRPDERGWIWSAQLESWLVEDGPALRLYTADGQRHLTGDEVAELALRRATEAETEVTRQMERLNQAEAEALQHKQRASQAEAEATQQRQRAEAAEARLKKLEEQMQQNNPQPGS